MNLDPLEADFWSDMGADDHGLWELFEFVRLHYPHADDGEVLRRGRLLLSTWLSRGWLELARSSAKSGAVDSIDGVLPLIDRLETSSTRFFVGAPWIRLTLKATADVPWLKDTK